MNRLRAAICPKLFVTTSPNNFSHLRRREILASLASDAESINTLPELSKVAFQPDDFYRFLRSRTVEQAY